MLKKLRSGFLFIVGFLLSPLCWWNDLLINLPLAYGCGLIFSWFSADLLLPGSIVGYWLSNILGILLMQWGAVDFFEQQSQERNLKKDLLVGLLSSTAFTIVIVVLIGSNILDLPLISSLTATRNTQM